MGDIRFDVGNIGDKDSYNLSHAWGAVATLMQRCHVIDLYGQLINIFL